MCTCLANGRTTDPPVPRDWLTIDEDGNLCVRKEHSADGGWIGLYEWQETACPHPHMRLLSEDLANWSGLRAFQQALRQVGWERFPTLRSELPETNDGQMPASQAALARSELALFQSLDALGKETFLVYAATGEAMHQRITFYAGVFMFGDGYEAGLDPTAFFVRDPATGESLFRSAHFRQIRPSGCPDPEVAELEDIDLGDKYQGHAAVRSMIPWPDGRWQNDAGVCNFKLLAELRVELRSIVPADFEYIVAPLLRLCEASVETGNPVRWE
jgi:hypothetical protein